MSVMPEPPYSSGSSKPMRSSVAELLPQRGGITHGSSSIWRTTVERAMARQQVAHGLAQELLFLVEIEIKHGEPLSSSASASMLRW